MGKKDTTGGVPPKRKSSKKGKDKGTALHSSGGSLVIAEKLSKSPMSELPLPPPQQSIFQNSENNKSLSRKSSTKMKIPPSLAAAMLSLPWPPPENPKLLLAKRREEAERLKLESTVAEMKEQISKKQESDDDENGNTDDGHHCCGNAKSCCCGTTKQVSRGQSSRKLYMKKKSQTSVVTKGVKGKECCLIKNKKSIVFNGNSRRKSGDPYVPVTVPPFKHVHTAWPGFDHAPVANWKKKYLIAKPWPYQNQRWPQQNNRVQFNDQKLDNMMLLLTVPSAQTDLLNSNFTGRSFASLRHASSAASSTGTAVNHDHNNSKMGFQDESLVQDISVKEADLPKQRIHLQRVGSCLK